MMKFEYFMPTQVLFGRDCVLTEGKLFATLGKHALIVTGKSSRKNGALSDVCAALQENGCHYTVYDRVTPNPDLPCVREGIALLKSVGADFIVAVGGGSPMDAAKAIALLAVQDRADEGVFAGGYEACALPMAHVPTTAGTGSEVTQYSVLTNDVLQTKMSISHKVLFPRFAFLDGKYMQELPNAIAVNTALDALSHAIEGMLSRNATPVSDALAQESMRVLTPLLQKMTVGELSLDDRDGLLYGSMLAGMTIAQSGTTAVHGLGYALTYFCNIDHGRANALLLGETLRLCEEKSVPQLSAILQACGQKNASTFCDFLDGLLGEKEVIPRETLLDFAERSKNNKNIFKSVYEPTEGEVFRIFLRSFGMRE